MSCNIISIDTIDCDAFCITRPNLDEIRKTLRAKAIHWPEGSIFADDWMKTGCDEVRGMLFVKRFEWRGEGSGYTFDALKAVVLPAFHGSADMVLSWEGGDHSGLRLLNGKVTEHEVIFALGKERK